MCFLFVFAAIAGNKHTPSTATTAKNVATTTAPATSHYVRDAPSGMLPFPRLARFCFRLGLRCSLPTSSFLSATRRKHLTWSLPARFGVCDKPNGNV